MQMHREGVMARPCTNNSCLKERHHVHMSFSKVFGKSMPGLSVRCSTCDASGDYALRALDELFSACCTLLYSPTVLEKAWATCIEQRTTCKCSSRNVLSHEVPLTCAHSQEEVTKNVGMKQQPWTKPNMRHGPRDGSVRSPICSAKEDHLA
eukprot:5242457-Amphidinium_carterae.1